MSDENKVNLIFVFNADTGGRFKSFIETLHKTFKPSTYDCNLCAVAYGAFGMKKEFKKFINNLDVPVEAMGKDIFDLEFVHRDEFDKKYNITDAKYPSAYLEDSEGIKLFISQDEMNSVEDVKELITLVEEKIKEFKI